METGNTRMDVTGGVGRGDRRLGGTECPYPAPGNSVRSGGKLGITWCPKMVSDVPPMTLGKKKKSGVRAPFGSSFRKYL